MSACRCGEFQREVFIRLTVIHFSLLIALAMWRQGAGLVGLQQPRERVFLEV